jgi:AcrR family transcriptional regulator
MKTPLRSPQASKARARLMQTARRLFTQRGYSNVGINDVIAEAGIARMTLYNYFASKDDLIVAVYEEMASEILASLAGLSSNAVSERESVRSIFEQMRQESLGPNFRGCWLTHASYQAPDVSGAIFDIVSTYKGRLRAHFYDLLDENRRNRDQLADQLVLLADGAMTEAYLRGVADAFSAAYKAAEILLAHSE